MGNEFIEKIPPWVYLIPWFLHGCLCLLMGARLILAPANNEPLVRKLFKMVHGFTFIWALTQVALYCFPTTRSLFPQTFILGKWVLLKDYVFDWAFTFNSLSLMYYSMTLILVGIIINFSFQFLHRETHFERFFFLIEVLCFAVCTISLSGNFDVLFFGWELTGVASVLLISFFMENIRSIQNGLRAFIFYRICDIFMLLALVRVHHNPQDSKGIIGLLFILASLAKSGQFPFINFLPRAMEGPTASSAIFYGALSVHLGPFLLMTTASYWQFSLTLKFLIFAIGFTTCIFSTLIGRTRSDAKTLLAYAVMGQIGIIYMELALGFWTLAKIHIVGHAGLRTLQFLRTSSLIHDFMENPSLAIDFRMRRKVSPEILWQPQFNKKMYIHAVQGFYMDYIQFNLIADSFNQFCRVWKDFMIGQPKKRYLWSLYSVAFLMVCFLPTWVRDQDEMLILGLLMGLAFLWATQSIVQDTAAKSMWSMFLSLLALGISGALCDDVGQLGSFFLIVNYGLSFFVLFAIQTYLQKKYQANSLGHYWGLATQEKKLEVLFLLAGLLAIGLPGGLAFLGEDLIFHALLSKSPWFTGIHVVLMGLNGIGFLRIYQHLFLGRSHLIERDGEAKVVSHWKILGLVLPLIVILILSVYPDVCSWLIFHFLLVPT